MFTGIIESIGEILNITEMDTSSSGGRGWSIIVRCGAEILSDVKLGDSICVNGISFTILMINIYMIGVCLTATEFLDEKSAVKFQLSPETLRRTNLGKAFPYK